MPAVLVSTTATGNELVLITRKAVALLVLVRTVIPAESTLATVAPDVSVMPDVPPWIAVNEAPADEPRLVVWSVPFAPKLHVTALAAQLADRLVVLALLPMFTVAAFVAPRLVVPAPVVSTATAPVPVDCRLKVVPEVLALITGFAPPKVRFPPWVTAPVLPTV